MIITACNSILNMLDGQLDSKKDVAILVTVSICILLPIQNEAAKVAMKIVESPMAYGFNNDLISPNLNHGSLTLPVQPSNFSGPRQLRNLLENCYNYTDETYLYTFCPFNNVTQVEQSTRWNAYQGVLGVWQEWKIINNTFHSMMMLNGDLCENIHRSVEVVFECNATDGIKQITEPSKCNYMLLFQTPLVCHEDSLLVYPRLPTELQNKWDDLESELFHQDITHKGYVQRLEGLFREAGFLLSSNHDIKHQKNVSLPSIPNSLPTDIEKCTQEVNELRRELEALKLLLELPNSPLGRV